MMFSMNEEEMKAAIVAKAADEFLQAGHDISGLVKVEVKRRVDLIFKDRAEAQIGAAVDVAINNGFDLEYQRVNSWGQPDGEKTTVRKQLDKLAQGYWGEHVDPRSGKSTDSGYTFVTRAEYLMTQICAKDFSENLKASALNVTGALKDGLRNQLGAQMDQMLNELFRVKSLQDQGKVEKPY
jgi:hypothetical protein